MQFFPSLSRKNEQRCSTLRPGALPRFSFNSNPPVFNHNKQDFPYLNKRVSQLSRRIIRSDNTYKLNKLLL